MKGESTTIYRDVKGKPFETSAEAASSNLGHRIGQIITKGLCSGPEMKKADPTAVAMGQLTEILVLIHWVQNNPADLEELIRTYLEESRGDKAVTQA